MTRKTSIEAKWHDYLIDKALLWELSTITAGAGWNVPGWYKKLLAPPSHMHKIFVAYPWTQFLCAPPPLHGCNLVLTHIFEAHSNHVTSSKRADTLVCHTTMRRYSINFLYNLGQNDLPVWCLANANAHVTVLNVLLNVDECKQFEIRTHSSLLKGQMHKIFFFRWAWLKVRK